MFMFKQTTLSDYWKSEDSAAGEDSDRPIQDDNVDQLMNFQARFKNLYWSRIISLQDDMLEQYERWPMAPDIKENAETLALLDL